MLTSRSFWSRVGSILTPCHDLTLGQGQPADQVATTRELLRPVGGGVCVTPAGAAVMEAAGMDGREYRLPDLRAGLTALADFWRIEVEN